MAARFLARPQRFLALVELADGEQTLAYCANPGSFHGCLDAGSRCLLWDSGNTTRKRRYTLGAIRVGKTWVGTDTHLANRLIHLALMQNLFSQFAVYSVTAREPRSSSRRRLDFKLDVGDRQCFVEVKSVAVANGAIARFPDSVSPRASCHLAELKKLARAGHRAAMIFLIQRGDVHCIEINKHADLAFARAANSAAEVGVEFLAYKHTLSVRGFGFPVEVPVIFRAN